MSLCRTPMAVLFPRSHSMRTTYAHARASPHSTVVLGLCRQSPIAKSGTTSWPKDARLMSAICRLCIPMLSFPLGARVSVAGVGRHAPWPGLFLLACASPARGAPSTRRWLSRPPTRTHAHSRTRHITLPTARMRTHRFIPNHESVPGSPIPAGTAGARATRAFARRTGGGRPELVPAVCSRSERWPKTSESDSACGSRRRPANGLSLQLSIHRAVTQAKQASALGPMARCAGGLRS